GDQPAVRVAPGDVERAVPVRHRQVAGREALPAGPAGRFGGPLVEQPAAHRGAVPVGTDDQVTGGRAAVVEVGDHVVGVFGDAHAALAELDDSGCQGFGEGGDQPLARDLHGGAAEFGGHRGQVG